MILPSRLTSSKKQKFLEALFSHYDTHAREMPWRQTTDPYKIMVSEIMLQQTQVNRVTPKYKAFLEEFPDVESLARADLAKVLGLWSGLGYNRRAKFLCQAAKKIISDFGSMMPRTLEELVELPGIGKNTAGAIIAYAYNTPTIFIETNIRTVLIYHFFADRHDVNDKELEELLGKLLHGIDDPRTFYWAMMDYGTWLKSNGNNIKQSKHYVKQSKFHGSKRQIRGEVIKQLIKNAQTLQTLQQTIPDERLESVLNDLVNEQLIVHKNNRYSLG